MSWQPSADGRQQPYRYRWRNCPERARLYGRACMILRRLTMNSALVEFVDDGERQVVSRNALRKAPC